MTEPDLENLRLQLDEVDAQVLKLVQKRQDLVRDIGRCKSETGTPTRDFARERVVIEKSRTVAREIGLSEDLAEHLMQTLIQSSLARQEADRISDSAQFSGKALVIGGAGLMGSWFSGFLAASGYEVEISDPSRQESSFTRRDNWEDVLDSYDLIALATPISVTKGLLTTIGRRRPPGIICDLCSLKGPLRTELRALADSGLRVSSLHPMFGPDTQLLSGRHVIVVNVGHPEANNDIANLFSPTMASVVEMDLEDHDRLIAYVLGLSHALNIAFFTALRESGEASEQLARLSSTTFDAQLSVASRVAAENPAMYFEIQSMNDYQQAPYQALIGALDRLRNQVAEKDSQGFQRLMQLGHEYLARRKK